MGKVKSEKKRIGKQDHLLGGKAHDERHEIQPGGYNTDIHLIIRNTEFWLQNIFPIQILLFVCNFYCFKSHLFFFFFRKSNSSHPVPTPGFECSKFQIHCSSAVLKSVPSASQALSKQ